MISIRLIEADITSLSVDAIVCAASSTLLGGTGVDRAIHYAAGPALFEHCRHLGGCKTGQAVLTPGFNLPAKYIIHTVGPIWRGGEHFEETRLADCYRNSLKLASENNIRSIAFPAISCGNYGYPLMQACQIALGNIRLHASGRQFPERIYLACHTKDIWKAFKELLG
ncbi:macro domain-containing protein [Aestuariibacter sp. A3R04]|uniref:macro domain-containing protein n=1 Tax=Aestuariibacter sp. A3R04 TaxID=2841571 RepID=UPI001C0A645E|nr:macro domain-containing protein [Aestuariibacter sp. A3R04]MBU3023970.1 macro domain-containing protein [Aestuariibacter sp. A3R04]